MKRVTCTLNSIHVSLSSGSKNNIVIIFDETFIDGSGNTSLRDFKAYTKSFNLLYLSKLKTIWKNIIELSP